MEESQEYFQHLNFQYILSSIALVINPHLLGLSCQQKIPGTKVIVDDVYLNYHVTDMAGISLLICTEKYREYVHVL